MYTPLLPGILVTLRTLHACFHPCAVCATPSLQIAYLIQGSPQSPIRSLRNSRYPLCTVLHGPSHFLLECYSVGIVLFPYTHYKFLEVRNHAFLYSSPAQNTIPYHIKNSEVRCRTSGFFRNRVYAH